MILNKREQNIPVKQTVEPAVAKCFSSTLECLINTSAMVYKYRFPLSTDIKTQHFSVIINITMTILQQFTFKLINLVVSVTQLIK